MGWTAWRKIADYHNCYDDDLDWEGATCYELAIAGPRGGDRRTVYVGETQNEQKRIAAYARYGSHLSDIIDDHLRRGWTLWYRSQTKPTKEAAVAMQERLLGRFDYDWNIQLNADDKD